MTGLEAFLLVTVVGAIVPGAIFGILWFRQRNSFTQLTETHQEMALQHRALIRARSELEQRLTKVTNALSQLRTQAKSRIDALNASASGWRTRYENLAQTAKAESELHQQSERIRCELEQKIALVTTASDRDAAQAKSQLDAVNASASKWKAMYTRLAHWEPVEDAAAVQAGLDLKISELRETEQALRNLLDGYGTRYIIPPESALDDLANEAAHKASGQNLKEARENSRTIAKSGTAVICGDSDSERRQAMQGFVLSSYNCKVEAILDLVKSDNLGTLRQRMKDTLRVSNEHSRLVCGAYVSDEYHKARLEEMKWAARVQQYRALQKEEQRQLKVQMREEAKVQRELERAQRLAAERAEEILKERERIEQARAAAVAEERARQEARLREELARVSDLQRVEVEGRLRSEMEQRLAVTTADYAAKLEDADARIRELEEQRERAKSMAQQTKRGTVYVISNIGSFGDGVFKIGQTRRLEPLERIWELGDASVPFEFDVHALIPSDDAPSLEYSLHERFIAHQVNKVNWRKEFFRVSLREIMDGVESMGIKASWTLAAEARQFRESQAIELRMAQEPEYKDQWVREQLGQAESAIGTLREDDEVEVGVRETSEDTE